MVIILLMRVHNSYLITYPWNTQNVTSSQAEWLKWVIFFYTKKVHEYIEDYIYTYT